MFEADEAVLGVVAQWTQKAVLVLQGIEFPRTHHISMLLNLLPAHVRPDLTPEEQERLTDYAVSTRYPGDYEPIPLTDAQRAVKIARRAHNQLRKQLPREALRMR